MTKNYILTISEGEKTEKQFLSNIKKVFFQNLNKEIIFLPFCANIYTLYKILEEDDFETDIVEILKERFITLKNKRKDVDFSKEEKILLELDRDSISEIYLFFDYDPHTENRVSDDKILKMIEYFNNETENGKIYISYPMIEASKHYSSDNISTSIIGNFEDFKKYKKLVSVSSDIYNITQLKKEEWLILLSFNLLKLLKLFNKNEFKDKNEYFEYSEQLAIFKKQSKILSNNKQLIILGSFPLFLIDYYKEDFFLNIINSETYKQLKNKIK